MELKYTGFGQIEIDGRLYTNDVVIEGKNVVSRKRSPKPARGKSFGHTPLRADENIPWNCKLLVIGTGYYGSLPVDDEVHQEAKRRQVEIKSLPTGAACEYLSSHPDETNAVLHLTC